jgi:hypothetical protein
MAETKRLKIIQHLIATAEAIESIKSVGYGSFEVLQKPRPALGILPDDEITERYPDDIYSERAGLACRIAVDEAGDRAGLELERIIGDLHAALLADPTRGGLADDTWKVGIASLFTDQNYPRAGADFKIIVQYQTNENDAT